MRIVQIEDYFHPDAGYQINILSKYMAKDGNEVYIVTSQMEKIPKELSQFFGSDDLEARDKAFTESTGVHVIRLPIYRYYSGRSIYTPDLFRKVDSLKPDILYLHGASTYATVRFILRTNKLNYPYITDTHMNDQASVNKMRNIFYYFYKKTITPILVKNKIQVIRTGEIDYIQKRLGIPLNQAPVIGFGSDVMIFKPDASMKIKVRRELSIEENAFVAIYAGKLDRSKGGLFLAEAIEKKFNANKEIVFVIIGNTVGEYGDKVEAKFKVSQNRIIRLPTQKHIELARYYQAADVALFPKECSLSFYDVQACGLPVLFEDYEVNHTRSSEERTVIFNSGDILDFRSKLEALCNMDKEEFKKMSQNSYRYIIENYSYWDKYHEYMKAINKQISIFRSKG